MRMLFLFFWELSLRGIFLGGRVGGREIRAMCGADMVASWPIDLFTSTSVQQNNQIPGVLCVM